MSLMLGPIVGHTDSNTSRIWIQVDDDPHTYALRIPDVGVFPFASTEEQIELGTAIAIAENLRSDRSYSYDILHRDRVVAGSGGGFRTMPHDLDGRGISFATVSCSSNRDLGCWPDLEGYIFSGVAPVPSRKLRIEKPRFLLMVGDQVYVDQETKNGELGKNAWEDYFFSTPEERRAAIAQWYQESWGRDVLRHVMSNIPTYMMWDDHEIRNGWGSLAHDSPTIASQYPENARLQKVYNDIFEDFRYVYWHFQRSHGPPPGSLTPPVTGERRAMPSVFRVSRVLVLMIDTRGDRDVFRDEDDKPALGRNQWEFINEEFENIPPEVDYLIVTTAAPIAHYSKNAIAQQRVPGYPAYTTYDVRAFRGGAFIGGNGELWQSTLIPRNLRPPIASVRGIVTDVRDQWPHHYTRAEQEQLLRAAARAQFANRLSGKARELVFVAGDVHFGGDYRIKVRSPVDFKKKSHCRCFFSSGISKKIADKNLEGKLIPRDVRHRFRTKRKFWVAKGITSKLKQTEWRMNIGIIQTEGFPNIGVHTSLQSTKPFSKDRSVRRKQKRK